MLAKARSTRSSDTLLGRSWLSIMWLRAASSKLMGTTRFMTSPVISAEWSEHNRAACIVQLRQPFQRLFVSEAGEKLLGGELEERMPPIRRNFGERGENEPALVQPGMRQR